MNLPEIVSYDEQAIDTLVSVINKAKEALGERQTLKELANSRDILASHSKLTLTSLECPLAITSEALIRNAIEKKWNLKSQFKYVIKYMGVTKDEASQYYYFEVIFSQPTIAYPIPQVTASVFFRVDDKLVDAPANKKAPNITFRIEGHRYSHDIRNVLLTADRLMAVLVMKKKVFKRIEEIRYF